MALRTLRTFLKSFSCLETSFGSKFELTFEFQSNFLDLSESLVIALKIGLRLRGTVIGIF